MRYNGASAATSAEPESEVRSAVCPLGRPLTEPLPCRAGASPAASSATAESPKILAGLGDRPGTRCLIDGPGSLTVAVRRSLLS